MHSAREPSRVPTESAQWTTEMRGVEANASSASVQTSLLSSDLDLQLPWKILCDERCGIFLKVRHLC